ncbi:unnamed protein product, partial [Rotaria socialis]
MAQYYDRISPCCIRYFSFYSYLPLSISRKEGLPYIGVKLAKRILVSIPRTCRYIDLSVVCSIHVTSLSVLEEPRLSMAPIYAWPVLRRCMEGL